MGQRSVPVLEAIKILFAAAIYFLVATISLRFSYDASNATPIWPPSGFGFALLLMFGRRMWPGIFFGAFAANVFVFIVNETANPFTATWTSLIIAAGNSLEAIAGFWLVQRFMSPVKPIDLFDKVRCVFNFFYTSIVMCLVSCSIGATVILAAGIIQPENFLPAWFTWWIGDAAGILLFTPLIISWYYYGRSVIRSINNFKLAEIVFITVATVLTTGLVFFDWFEPEFVFTRAFIIIPFLIMAAVRLPLPMVGSLLVFTAIMTVAGTLEGIGPFVNSSLNDSLITAATFNAVNSIMVLVLRAAISEDEQMKQWLVSAKDQLELAVKDRTKELEVKNLELNKRNQELASFNYAASHDLQEPLRKIFTFTDRILEVEKDRMLEKSKEYFVRIQHSTERMKKLIDNLMDYLHVDSKERLMERIDLNEILKQVMKQLYSQGSDVKLRIEAAKLPVIKGVAFQFEQLFTNLLSNSLKFRREGVNPHIIIESELVDAKEVELFINEPAGRYHHICFQDNGIGFNNEYADRIFDIFQRLHGYAEYAGSGIGLAICKRIVENHGGYIHAVGKEGEGAVFHIYLPAGEGAEYRTEEKGIMNVEVR